MSSKGVEAFTSTLNQKETAEEILDSKLSKEYNITVKEIQKIGKYDTGFHIPYPHKLFRYNYPKLLSMPRKYLKDAAQATVRFDDRKTDIDPLDGRFNYSEDYCSDVIPDITVYFIAGGLIGGNISQYILGAAILGTYAYHKKTDTMNEFGDGGYKSGEGAERTPTYRGFLPGDIYGTDNIYSLFKYRNIKSDIATNRYFGLRLNGKDFNEAGNYATGRMLREYFDTLTPQDEYDIRMEDTYSKLRESIIKGAYEIPSEYPIYYEGEGLNSPENLEEIRREKERLDAITNSPTGLSDCYKAGGEEEIGKAYEEVEKQMGADKLRWKAEDEAARLKAAAEKKRNGGKFGKHEEGGVLYKGNKNDTENRSSLLHLDELIEIVLGPLNLPLAASDTMNGITNLYLNVMSINASILIAVLWLLVEALTTSAVKQPTDGSNTYSDKSKNAKNYVYSYAGHFQTGEEHIIDIFAIVLPTLIVLNQIVPTLGYLYNEEILYGEKTLSFGVNIIGNQGFGTYEYLIDLRLDDTSYKSGVEGYTLEEPIDLYFTYNSVMLSDAENRLLDVDKSLVLPIHTNVVCSFTSRDVIHSWALPQMGIKVDCIPGRITSTILNSYSLGVFYGQCSELCGPLHGFMPICVEIILPDYFVIWALLEAKLYASDFNFSYYNIVSKLLHLDKEGNLVSNSTNTAKIDNIEISE